MCVTISQKTQKADTFVKNVPPQKFKCEFLVFWPPLKCNFRPPEKSKFRPLEKIKCEGLGFPESPKPKPWHVFSPAAPSPCPPFFFSSWSSYSTFISSYCSSCFCSPSPTPHYLFQLLLLILPLLFLPLLLLFPILLLHLHRLPSSSTFPTASSASSSPHHHPSAPTNLSASPTSKQISFSAGHQKIVLHKARMSIWEPKMSRSD